VSRGQRGGSPTVVNLSFLDRRDTEVGTKIRRPAAVAQSVQFTCGLKTTEFVVLGLLINYIISFTVDGPDQFVLNICMLV
jgi:hypothetical protein